MSSVTDRLFGVVILLLVAWHVRTMCRCFRFNLSKSKTFFTFLSDNTVDVSSKSVFSCHHVRFGSGRPEMIKKIEKKKCQLVDYKCM